MFKEWDTFKTIYASVFILLVVATAATTLYFFQTQKVFTVKSVETNQLDFKTTNETEVPQVNQETETVVNDTEEELNQLPPPDGSTENSQDNLTTKTEETQETIPTNTETNSITNSDLATDTEIPELTFIVEGETVLSGEVAFVVETLEPVREQLILFTYSQDQVLLRQRALDPSPTNDRWQTIINTESRYSNGIYTFKVGILDNSLEPVIYHEGYTREIFNLDSGLDSPVSTIDNIPEVSLKISPDLDVYSGEVLNFTVTTEDAKEKELSVYIRSKTTSLNVEGVSTPEDDNYYYSLVGHVALTPNQDGTVWTGQGSSDINLPAPGLVDSYEFFVGKTTNQKAYTLVNRFDTDKMYLIGPTIKSNKDVEERSLLYTDKDEAFLSGTVRVFYDYPQGIYRDIILSVERIERAGTGTSQITSRYAEYTMQANPDGEGYFYDLDTTEIPNATYNFVTAVLADARASNRVKLNHSFIATINNDDVTEEVEEENEEVPTFTLVRKECVEYGFGDSPELCQRLMSFFLDAECRDAGITTEIDCEEFKKQIYLNQACERVNILNEVECREFLADEYVNEIDCQGRSDFECRQLIQDNFLGQLLGYIQVRDRVSSSLENVSNTTVPLSRVLSAVESIEEVPNLVPVKQRSEVATRIRVLNSLSATTITSDQELKTSLPYALAYDADGDGLLDDAEKRYGTDLNNPDTDGDGFLDGEELKNGYDPLGPGEFTKTLVPIDEAILKGVILEQPTTRGSEDSELVINVINNFENNNGLVFSGLAKPNQVLTIFIYSGMPLVLTTSADEQGQWTYYLDDPLNDDIHDAYVTVTDETGRIEAKSPALSFFVREARAVSVEDYVLDEVPSDIIGSSVNDQIWRFVIGGIILVLLALIIFVVIHVRRSKGPAEQVTG